MSSPPCRCWRTRVVLPCALLLAFAASLRADPKPLSKEEQAKVDKAVDKGVAFLKKAQTEKGDFDGKMYQGTRYVVGQCALPAYALLEAGVPTDDPVISKAAQYIRSECSKANETYELSLAILFFDRLGDPKDKKLIQRLALRLIAGQYRSGGWSYHCPLLSEKNEGDLLGCLEKLRKRMKQVGKARAQALKEIDVPEPLTSLTVFQTADHAPYREPLYSPEAQAAEMRRVSLDGRTDNSNTQFAILALWAARRHDVAMLATFEIMVEHFERSQEYPSGLWTYQWDKQYGSPRSMICVGLLGLAIGRGLHLSTPGEPADPKRDVHVLRGLSALRQCIGTPLGHMKRRGRLPDLYFLWSVERVGMLYNLTSIGGKDWYRWEAELLVTNQLKDGRWPPPAPSKNEDWIGKIDYGPSLNTAFALLILKCSHPMKNLTPKLPFSEWDLTEGLTRLRRDEQFPERTASDPSSRAKPDR